MSEAIVVNIDGVGDFVYSKPSIGQLMQIDREYGILVGQSSQIIRLNVLASMVSIHRVTMISCPNGWEKLEERGSEDDATIADLLVAYRAKEDSFRVKANPVS